MPTSGILPFPILADIKRELSGQASRFRPSSVRLEALGRIAGAL